MIVMKILNGQEKVFFSRNIKVKILSYWINDHQLICN